MEAIRTLSLIRYSRIRKRFTSDCFCNYRNGISVFDSVCATRSTPAGVCVHIERFYPSSVNNNKPFAYWKIDTDILLQRFDHDRVYMENTPSDTGDPCHYNIRGLSDNKASSFKKSYCIPPSLFLCVGDDTVQLTNEQYESLPVLLQQYGIDIEAIQFSE